MTGVFFYCNPILLPFTIHKELYILEINIRNFVDEKRTGYYKY
jgi:hypothetical protein